MDVSLTTVEEQRSTEWTQYQSLRDFPHPAPHRKTTQRRPSPRRAGGGGGVMWGGVGLEWAGRFGRGGAGGVVG
ncbi:hypothetical protein B1218_36675 [Pseudomonas ogarae]|nr:hypothetical protein B1218_36675 [Pseudomonas ogarae]